MALLQRTRILPQQRLDLPDFRNIEDFVCADFKAQFKNIWTGENFVLKGFDSTGLGTNELNIVIAGSALIVGADDGTMFIGAPSVADAVTDALTPAATNYVEISIEQDTGGADSRAFWDPTAAAGLGGEFSQIVDTFIFTKIKLNINTSNFTGSPDMVPVCEVDVNGSGIITDIRDARNMFWRLGRRGQTNYTFPWVSRTEPPVSQFDGADKDITSEKAWKDAVMSRILELDGGNFWFENSGVSLVGGFRNTGLSMVTGQSTDAKWAWDGSLLTLTDSNGTPADADVIAAIRLLDSTANLMLTRQDGTGGSTAFALADGDVLWVELPDPLANVNYNAIGLTASNFRVSPRGSVPNDSNTFWLAHRDGANVYLRFFGELQPGEDVEISDNVNENILAAIGIATETDMPNYTSNNIVVDGTSLVAAVSALDAAAGISGIQANQDRSLKLIEGGTWAVDYLGTTLSWSADAFIDVPEVTRVSNRILAGNINLPNANSVAYVEVNRASGPATLTVNVADIDALIPTENTVIIARRVSTGILVGRTCFLLKAGEYLELDGALAEINRKLGQLKLRPHETAADKARIDAADILQLDDSVLSQIIGDFLLKFDGAVINFTTGVINEADDVTPLGINFTPFTIPAGEYFWYGVSLIPGDVLADNTQEAQVQIDLAASANASASAAVKPVISGDIKLGAVQVQNNGGNIELVEVRKLGVGSGSGSGSGDANAVDTALRDRFSLNNFLFLTENVFRTDKDLKVDPASTGDYSPAKKAFGFSAIGQTLVSTNHLDADFLDDGIDVSEVELYLFWLNGFQDNAATYEVSRDGGTNWQTADMERIGQTNAYRVHHTFTDEVTQQSLALIAPTGAGTALNATTAQQLSSELVISDTSVVKFLNLELNRAAAAVGNLFAQIVKDNAGVPSTDPADIVSESNAISISGLGTGDLTLAVDMPDVVLTPATYHVVLRTDAAYKAGTMDLSWRSGAGTDGAAYDGSVWTGGASTKAFEAEGRELDLRVRVTSSVGDVFIEGYGIYYDSSIGIQPSSTRKIQKFVFSGDDNETEFTCNFQVDPYIVTVHDVYRGQSYVPDSASDSPLRVDGNTLKFAADTFDFPGETIVLIVRQLEGNGVDVSQENSQKIFEIEQNLIDIGDELASISDSMVLPKIAVPFTQISNRPMIPDLMQDLKARHGTERFHTHQLVQMFDEMGPNGETVYAPVNDRFGLVRFVGTWRTFPDATSTTAGLYAESLIVNSFVEVTFVGTGLNLLGYNNGSPTWGVTVDGGSETIIAPPASISAFLVGNRFGLNTKNTLISGLAYGIHTVKLRLASGYLDVHGFEIINDASNMIRVNPGTQLYKGRRLTNPTLTLLSPNSGFAIGTLGSRGGRGVIYQKSNGLIEHGVNPTDSVQGNLGSANHNNEELSRTHNYHGFGANKTDDFSFINTANVNRGFTMDDGTTALIGNQVQSIPVAGRSSVGPGTLNGYLTMTFVGTGLDVSINGNDGLAYSASYQIFVDGIEITSGSTAASTIFGRSNRTGTKWIKLVSGLPLGTHTVKIVASVAGVGEYFNDFRVYIPKKPTIPSGAVEIAEYLIPANFIANTVGSPSSTSLDTISTGVIRKSGVREINFSGTWSAGAFDPTFPIGYSLSSTTVGGYVEHTFVGTGFDLRMFCTTVGTGNIQLLLDGSITNFSGYTTSFAGPAGTGFTAATGVVDGSASAGSGFVTVAVSNLPYGKHTIRATIQSTGMVFCAFDEIVSTYAPIDNGPFVLQNTLMVGSNSLKDLRKFSEKEWPSDYNLSLATGGIQDPNMASSTQIPMPEMSVEHYSKTGKVRISYSTTMASSNAEMQNQVFMDGQLIGRLRQARSTTGTPIATVADSFVLKVSKGYHKFDIFWSSGGAANLVASDRLRNLVIEDVD